MPFNKSTGKMGPNKGAGKKANSVTLGPGGSFPAGDKKHAKLAVEMAPKSYNAGNISKGTEQKIMREGRALEGKQSKPASTPKPPMRKK